MTLPRCSAPDLIRALGSSFLSNIADFIRRWKLALTSLKASKCGNHIAVPSWESNVWFALVVNGLLIFLRISVGPLGLAPPPFLLGMIRLLVGIFQ